MAKYFESSTDFSSRTLNSPVDLLRFIIAGVFLSPVRLIFEVSRKCLFLGEYLNKFILNAIYINLGLIVLSLGNSILFTKRIYVKGGFLPLSSLVVSVIILCVIYYFGSRYSLAVDFDLKDSIDDVVSKLEDVYGVESTEDSDGEDKEDVDSNTSLIDRINSSKDKPSNEDDEEIDITTEEDFDSLYDKEVEKSLEKVPKDVANSLQARLDVLKSNMKDNTIIHNKDVALLNSLKSNMDSLENKANTIREKYSGGDDDLEDRISMVDLIRKGKSLGEEIMENGGSFDDDPSMPQDISSYSKTITERANKRRQSLDSIVSSSNSSSMVDVDDLPSSNDELSSPSNPMLNNFMNSLNSEVDDPLDLNNGNDYNDNFDIDFVNDPMSIYTSGGIDFSDGGIGFDVGNF